jgi:ribosome-associated heat shock protein Hsp15
VRKPPAVFTYRIIEPPVNRVSAKLTADFIEDLSPAEEKIKLTMKLSGSGSYRVRGTGRPTKKERRDLDRIIDDPNDW